MTDSNKTSILKRLAEIYGPQWAKQLSGEIKIKEIEMERRTARLAKIADIPYLEASEHVEAWHDQGIQYEYVEQLLLQGFELEKVVDYVKGARRE
ncbi:hypothetical protein [Paenibacillus daejeonensis]|uniref:hypothetical protein n=1 Tax=Paenibacillus daejeonensis TaxID=135193 RepID=UPI000370B134|nr:hypothetical protein [Paenibacillus daejeonensis]